MSCYTLSIILTLAFATIIFHSTGRKRKQFRPRAHINHDTSYEVNLLFSVKLITRSKINYFTPVKTNP